MKKNNKKFAVLITALMFSGCVVNAKEVTIENMAGSQDVTVSYGVAGGYELVIPEDVSFDNNSLTVIGNVTASNVIIDANKKLQVTISSLNNWKLLNGGSAIGYQVTKNSSVLSNGAVVLEVLSGASSGTASLTFSTTEAKIAAATMSGAHEDKITFSAAVVSNN